MNNNCILKHLTKNKIFFNSIGNKMNTQNTYFIAVTIVLLAFCVQNGLSIKCWECRSDTDPKCADPFDNSTLSITDCKQVPELSHLPGVRPTMCRKVRQKVNGEWRYFRSCAYMGEPGIVGDERFCLMRTGTFNIFLEYCQCNSKDGCNSGHLAKPSVYTVLATLIFFAIAFVHRHL